MSKTDQKIEELIAKYPNLSKDEATKIVTEKNARKKQKRTEKTNKADAKRAVYEAYASKRKEGESVEADAKADDESE